jgi:hypothetical protein
VGDTFVEQVGGKHYQGEVQHWDVMEEYDVGYLEATATKYLMRWRKKGTPRVDLGKAASYIEKALKCRPFEAQTARRLVPEHAVHAMCSAAAVHWMDRDLIARLLVTGTCLDFKEVLEKVRETEEHAN